MEEYVCSYISDRKLISRIYKTKKGQKGPNFLKMGQGCKQFSIEEIKIAKKYLKKCSSFFAIQEMQIKSTLRFHLILVIMTKNQQKNR